MKKSTLMQRLSCLSFAFVLLAGLTVDLSSVRAEIQDIVDTKVQQDVIVYQGDLVTLKVYSLTRIAISNPGIVDISNADINEVTLIGRTVGETPVFIWDETGKRKLMVRVLQEDLDLIMARIKKLLESAEIGGITLQKNGYEGKVVVTGKVLKDQKKQVEKILEPFSVYVINLAREEIDMIQIDAQISELNTTLDKAMGIDWAAGRTDSFGLAYPETLPSMDGSVGDWFKIGNFSRVSIIQATVNALIIEGKGRILSKPSILVNNGEEANLLVGGEIPIKTTTTATGNAAALTENVTFKEYGITLNVRPEIIDDKVKIDLTVETRDIDQANSIADTAAFLTRSAKTKLNLNDGQTIVLAGLIKQSRGERVKRLPFLSDLPIVGNLFRMKTKPAPDQDLEMVVSLTPRIVKQQKYIDEEAAKKQMEKQQKDSELAEESSLPSLDTETSAKESKKEDVSKEQVAGAAGLEESPSETSSAEKSSTSKEAVGATIVETPVEVNAVSPVASNQEETKATPETLTAEPPAAPQTPETPAAAVPATPVTSESSAPSSAASTTEKKDTTSEMKATESNQDKVTTTVPLPEPSAEEKVAMLKTNVPVNDEQNSKAITDYVQKVQKKISQSISFPYEAKEKGWQGTVKLTLTILSNGDLNQVVVKESSGHDIFDKDAVNTAQIVAPFDAFPTEIKQQELVVTIPIVYNQDNSSL